jgi:mannose-6-phosphate isomerase-like protein (cupin superfamily)
MENLVRESLQEFILEDTMENPSINKTSKKGFHIDIETETINNKDFRRVLYTGQNLQLVLMTLNPGEEIGSETHSDIDQFFRFDEGSGNVIIDGNKYPVKDGDAIIIPAGAEHNIIADPNSSLKMYTIYSPPNHKDGVKYETKEEAEESEEEFDGITTE